MDNTLRSNILDVGSKFIVIGGGTSKALSIGTMGVIHYIEGVDNSSSNVAYAYVSILRRGKAGKDRLETEMIHLPIFYINDPSFTKMMPEDELEKYVYIQEMPDPFVTVYDMAALDYLRWAIPRAQYLYKLSKCTKLRELWPQKSSNIMSAMLNASNAWQEDGPYIYATCCSDYKRVQFVNQTRFMETILIPCAMVYKLMVIAMKKNAAQQLWKHYQTTAIDEVKAPLHSVIETLEKKRSGIMELKKKRTGYV